jgi:hypothetical protein
MTVTDCTLDRNSAGNHGGGIFSFGGARMTVGNSILTHNSASLGGGIDNGSAFLATLSGCTLSGNTASYGAGIYNDGTLTISQTTLSGNSASIEGGGIFNARTRTLTLLTTVVRDNVAPLGADLYNLGTAQVSTDSDVGVIAP